MRWSDLADWRGPTVNKTTGGMVEWRGLVVHIALGSYEGTIAWQRNPDANVSSHFVTDYDGKIAQVVDTADAAWTQRAGNGHWLSVENAGFTPNPLTGAQLDANARLLARMHLVYGVPLQVAGDPDGYGLGHHSMGCNWPAGAWGHCDCPGPAIIAQKQSIVDRARELLVPDRIEELRDIVTALAIGATEEGYLPTAGNNTGDKVSPLGQNINLQHVLVDIKSLSDKVQTLIDRPVAAFTAEQVTAMAGQVAAALVAAEDNPLTDAELAAVAVKVKQVLAAALSG